jgi:hypothetical protein
VTKLEFEPKPTSTIIYRVIETSQVAILTKGRMRLMKKKDRPEKGNRY